MSREKKENGRSWHGGFVITDRIKIRGSYADTDQMGVTHHARYFEYFERGRTELLRKFGVPICGMEEDGIRLPVVEAYCEYKKGIKYDQVILIYTSLRKPTGVRIRMDYEVYDEAKRDLLAIGYTVHAFVNLHGKVLRPPKDFARRTQDD
jgi:acyl-CoA thioester hydrolase